MRVNGSSVFDASEKLKIFSILNTLGRFKTSSDIIAGDGRERFMSELKFIEKCFFRVLLNF